MRKPTVDEVFELIGRMSEDDRIELEMRLFANIEAEWSDAVARNRLIACEKGVTEEIIDRAIYRRRYGG